MMVDPLFAVRDRVVVVTGGGGKLGGQFARALLARGAKVAVFDAADAAMVRDRYSDQDAKVPLRCFQVDVTNRDSIVSALRGVETEWGAPNGLINAAAIDAPPDAPPEENGPFETYPAASF